MEEHAQKENCESALHAYTDFYRNLDRATFHIQAAENLVAQDEDGLRAERDDLDDRMLRKERLFTGRCLVRR
jgi:hypothetical protein